MHSNVPCRSCGGVIPPARRSSAVYCSTPCGNRSRSAVYAARNPQKIKESRERQLSKTERRIHARLKSRAKKDGIPFNLDVSDIIVPPVCPILGTPLVDRTGLKAGGNYNTRSEEHTSEIQSLMRISYVVFCLTQKRLHNNTSIIPQTHKYTLYTLHSFSQYNTQPIIHTDKHNIFK